MSCGFHYSTQAVRDKIYCENSKLESTILNVPILVAITNVLRPIFVTVGYNFHSIRCLKIARGKLKKNPSIFKSNFLTRQFVVDVDRAKTHVS